MDVILDGMPGILYIVATPIGNLEDISARALRILAEVAVVACEDTRHSAKLLNHFGIRTTTVSFHQHNEAQRTEALLARLAAGYDVALVSDAGTPLICDPGARLVSGAIETGFRVVPVPGPSAMLAALSASGLPAEEFRFCGYLPSKAAQRRKRLGTLAGEQVTLIFYEAPHRAVDMLKDLAEIMGGRRVVLAREVSKVHEEFLRGLPSEVLAGLSSRPDLRGEITVIVGPPQQAEPGLSDREILREVEALVRLGTPKAAAIKAVAHKFRVPKRRIYSLVLEG